MREIPVNYRGFLIRREPGGHWTLWRLSDGKQVGGVYVSPTAARSDVDRRFEQYSATSRV
jgi:hypothetical protein